jgi:hypothetical protein
MLARRGVQKNRLEKLSGSLIQEFAGKPNALLATPIFTNFFQPKL